MKSDYERKNFTWMFWMVAGIFLMTTYVLLVFMGSSAGRSMKLCLAVLGAAEAVFVVALYFISKRAVDNAYSAVEHSADMMNELLRNSGEKEGMLERPDIKEGSVGILYDSFEKLVYMFSESRQRERLEKEYLKDVMSDISHQLKTPLASMSVFIDLLLNDKIDSPEERKKILSEAGNQVNRMEWMVLSMLKLARIEAGSVQFEKRDTEVSSVLDEVRGAISYLTNSRNQKLIINCPEGTIVQTDPEWMTEAIINIVKNASDYSKAEGDESASSNIEIDVEKNSVFTRIYIRDHGIGMSEETMTHIFDRFYRESNEVNPNSVGIGLSLSKSIVEGLGGKISVDSTLGEGSCFKIQI